MIEFCEDADVPLLERVRLLGIAAARLDVLFMGRVGRLKRQIAAGKIRKTDGPSHAEQLESFSMEARLTIQRAYRLLYNELLPALAAHDISIVQWETVDEEERRALRYACRGCLETLAPTIVDAPSEMPHVRNLRPALVAEATRRDGSSVLVGVELPADLPRLVPLPQGRRFVPVEQIIAAHLPDRCPELSLGDVHVFRVTRSAETDFDAAPDVLREVESEVGQRPFQDVVRVEVDESMPQRVRDRLLRGFEAQAETPGWTLGAGDTYEVSGLIDLSALEDIGALEIAALHGSPLERRATRLDQRLLEPGFEGNTLLHFPFDDYSASIEDFLREAAAHPDLESIQVTIYRTDRNSGVVAALREARARGAEASAVVEVKASFDERDNIELARSLSAAGVNVLLSPMTIKVHSKLALVTLRGKNGPHRVALIGTGNMNAITARAYVDLWLVTSDESTTREIAAVFDLMHGRAKDTAFECLLVAPFTMRRRFLEMISREAAHARAGRPAGFRAMLNGLTDAPLIEALYDASKAGVPIDLVVRGLCGVHPRVPGMSDNISVVSVVGRLLQHARVFHFRNGGEDVWLIGSADWRPRNLDGRIELVTTVREPAHVAVLDRILTETLATPDAWELGADGAYVRRTT